MTDKKHPERRKSALSGMSPVAPPPVQSTPAPAPVAAPVAKERTKTSFYQDVEERDRMRAAFVHTSLAEGTSSLSEFISRAVMREVERLEAEHNGGEPWPLGSAHQVPKGRPRAW